ncbi:MAG: hypothetical protein OXG56_07565 [Gammaproteobacteria bacterium]|nr:hypothetical protein [Gammaproteobacteria bacterium]
MPKIHFLNVNDGDCIVLEHDSGRVTVFDISAGNIPRQRSALSEVPAKWDIQSAKGNYRMCKHPTNPLDYLAKMGIKSIWRFILSHPDMDHLDGFNALLDEFSVLNFWDSGAKKHKPDFSSYGVYNEKDWDRYTKVVAGNEPGTNSIQLQAGEQFKYANEDDINGVGDALYILAPNQELVDEGNKKQDFNDASYIVLFCSAIGKVLLAGDAHDTTWEYVKENYKDHVSNVDLLIAPHHGRKSGRSYDFLEYVNPKLTFFGCAPSEHLAYDAWNYRNLAHITNNQCGCIVAEEGSGGGMAIYVENGRFAINSGGDIRRTNKQGFHYLCSV